MNWEELKTEEQIEKIKEESKNQPVLIFKHSTRCAISSTALSRLERNWDAGAGASVKTYYLDLLSYRNISQKIAESFNVAHESPQVLILKDGNPKFVSSHLAISFEKIREAVLKIK